MNMTYFHNRKTLSSHTSSWSASILREVLLLTVLAFLMPTLVLATPLSTITAIYVFGDSLSDGGNAYLLTGGSFPPTPPYDQRFSNGPVAVERLAANAGVSLTPSIAGGTNYAVGGAATGQVPIPGGGTTDNYATVAYPPVAPFLANTGIEMQVNAFKAGPLSFDPLTSLFVLWGGPNDFFINPSLPTVSQAVGDLTGELQQLYNVGARNFLVPNMPDLSLTPYGRSLPAEQQVGLHNLSVGFDTGLQSGLNSLAGWQGINIIQFDTFSFFNEIFANPAAYGFTNTTDPCFLATSGSVCADPNSYFFWDSVHPTAAGASLLGDRFTGAVLTPEPSSFLLLGTGLGALALAAWRRKK